MSLAGCPSGMQIQRQAAVDHPNLPVVLLPVESLMTSSVTSLTSLAGRRNLWSCPAT